MDRDTYEQLIQVQISLDELKDKINLVLDEIDELKYKTDKTTIEQFEMSKASSCQGRQV